MCAMPNEERLNVFKNMAEADPENELAHFSLGKVHLEMGNGAEAERSLRRVLELNPRHSQAMRFLGEALLRGGRREEGIRVLEEGIRVAHEKGEFHPRNQMQEILRKEGVEPPTPESAPGKAAGAEPEGFVCRRCGRANPPMDERPFPNELGKKIHATICQQCWREWIAMSIKVINEYRLNFLSSEGNAIYDQHMKEFLGLE
jgi:Fe-S cluster biosynthesis and repair protein YggX